MKSVYILFIAAILAETAAFSPVMAQQEELVVPGQNLYVNKIAMLQWLYPGLNGAGIRVSIKEFGFDTTDVDLMGRILPSPNASTHLSIHANIMASLVGGAGNADLAGRGAAPGCQIISSSFVGLQPDPDYLTQAITVQNHSYGVDIQNWYGAGALAYDQTTVENSSLLHVFSAGNKGDSSSIVGSYANISGFANLSGNFKMAKNVLVVGAVDSLTRVDPYSSQGPAYDGRTKPDLVAFGYDGTSGAAALVSGSAAVIQQALRESNTWPIRSDLVRAILINTADDLGAPGPDFESGFGNLDLLEAIQTTVNQQYTWDQAIQNQTYSRQLNLPAQLRQVKVTLVWNDPTAALMAPKALLNDLDLTLIDPLGNAHQPWVLNTFPNSDSLQQPAHRGRDTLNNVEQVTIDFPIPGTWTIRVSAAALVNGAQEFALAWTLDTLEHFAWNYPTLNDPTPSNREVILRWESNFPDTSARLEWRPWPSPDWRIIDDSVHLQSGWRRWILPDTFAESQLRMVVGGHEFLSDIFLISKELRMKIGFNCPDSVLLYWNSAHPSAQYQLFGLGEKYLEPIAQVTDTMVVLKKTDFPQIRFAVAPLTFWEDALGPRSPAPDISKQGVACYFSNFLAELTDSATVKLSLFTGTTYGLEKVFFEKQRNGNFTQLDMQLASQPSFEYEDLALQNGSNTYRPRLQLSNGTTLLGAPITVYYAGTQGWWVFPNPVPVDGILTIASITDGEAAFSLFDVLGKPVLSRTLDESGTKISLGALPRGVYFYKIRNGELLTGEGKLIIE